MDEENTSQPQFLSKKCYGVTLDIDLNAEKTRHANACTGQLDIVFIIMQLLLTHVMCY